MPLTDNRLLGIAGRLKCCLLYEFSTYQELRYVLPRSEHAVARPPAGAALHDRQGALRWHPEAAVVVAFPDGTEAEIPLDQLHWEGREPHPPASVMPAFISRRDLLRKRVAALATRTRHSSPTPWRATGACGARRRLLLTGTDEHGDKIAQAAAGGRRRAAGVRRPDLAEFRKTWDEARATSPTPFIRRGRRSRGGRPEDPPDPVGRRRDYSASTAAVLLRLRALLPRRRSSTAVPPITRPR